MSRAFAHTLAAVVTSEALPYLEGVVLLTRSSCLRCSSRVASLSSKEALCADNECKAAKAVTVIHETNLARAQIAF